jgi:hypothetical protein
MAISDYRFSESPRETDYGMEAREVFSKKKIKPSDFRRSRDEPDEDVVKRYYAALDQEAQAIKESRDPKREKKRQLKEREASMSKADEALKKEGVNPQDFWVSEPGLTRKSFTERTGKKIAIPEESRVGAVSREIETPRNIHAPEGGAVRQIAGQYGYGSTRLTPKGVADLEASRNKEFALAAMRERGGVLRMEREKREGAASTAKRQQWESDKQAYAEGVQLQRDANKQLAQIRRADTLHGRAVRAGRAAPYTPEQYMAIQDEKAMMQNIIGKKEGLDKKAITELGYAARSNRRKLAEEQQSIREAAVTGASSYLDQERRAQDIIRSMAPFTSTMNDEWLSSLFSGVASGFGGFGVPAPTGN